MDKEQLFNRDLLVYTYFSDYRIALLSRAIMRVTILVVVGVLIAHFVTSGTGLYFSIIGIYIGIESLLYLGFVYFGKMVLKENSARADAEYAEHIREDLIAARDQQEKELEREEQKQRQFERLERRRTDSRRILLDDKEEFLPS